MLPPERKANVYELAVQRLDRVFRDFDNIYVSFSGGKDSGALLNMCIDYIRRNGLKRKIGVYHMDYEVQYAETTKYVERMWADNADVLEVYHVCVPFKVPTCTSMFQTYWRPWDDGCRELWVREMPAYAYTKEDFEFYKEDMWDYDFQNMFALWYHEHKKAYKTCCLIGIRTQESFNRWRTIYSERRVSRYKDLKWTNRLEGNVYNAYVMYDWLTTDVWTANGKFGWDYNHLYDLYYMAGVPLEKQRVASPFLTTARESLHLYRAIDPDMWGKMICRVNGVNFTAIYGRSTATGRLLASPPPGHTWESYMNFLLSTLPQDISDQGLAHVQAHLHLHPEERPHVPLHGLLAHQRGITEKGTGHAVVQQLERRCQARPGSRRRYRPAQTPTGSPTQERGYLLGPKGGHRERIFTFQTVK